MIETIPVIDFTDFNRNKNKIISEWSAAFKKFGFAIIIGINCDQKLATNLYSTSINFFNLKKNEKMKFFHNGKYGDVGYTPMGLESVSKTTGTDEENRVNIKPDLVESIVFRKGSSIKHINLPNDILILCEKYWVDMLKILTLLMEVSALSLNLEENFFKSFFKNPSCSLRLAFYPKIEKIKEGTEIDYFPQTRYGAHTDYTGFTILRQDENPGLEVLINNQWIPVPYIPDSYVINSGDLIQRWTNDVFKSNLHRVSKPKDANKDRLSIVFFTGPDDDSIIIPIDSLCTIENPSKYPPISAFDHLMHKLNVSNVTIT